MRLNKMILPEKFFRSNFAPGGLPRPTTKTGLYLNRKCAVEIVGDESLVPTRPLSRKIWLFILVFVLITVSSFAAQEEKKEKSKNSALENLIMPEAYPIERYQIIWKRSPFTLSSIASNGGGASNYALAGYLKIGSLEYVTVVNKQTHETALLSTQPNDKGMRLVSVEPNNDPLKMTARVYIADEIEEIRYDPAMLAAKPVSSPPPIPGQGSAAFQPPGAPPFSPGNERLVRPERRIQRSAPLMPPSSFNQ